jgi:hypothetical protein
MLYRVISPACPQVFSVSPARGPAAPPDLAAARLCDLTAPRLCRGRLLHDALHDKAGPPGGGGGPTGGEAGKYWVRSVSLVPEAAADAAGGPELVVQTGDGVVAVVRAGTWAAKALAQGHTAGVRAVAAHGYKPLCASVCRRAVLLWDTHYGVAVGWAPVPAHSAPCL